MKRLLVAIAHGAGLFRLARWLNRDRVLVLTYHGVLPRAAAGDRHLCRNVVAQDEFERQMRHLVRHYRPLALGEVVDRLSTGRPIPEYAAAVTFDDGFRNNRLYAYPVLRRYGIPATIFLTTGHVGGGTRPLWTEEVALALARTAAPCLAIDLDGRGRLELRLRSERDRAAATRDLLRLLKAMPAQERERILERLAAQAPPVPEATGRDADRYGFLSWEEIREMADGGVEFGSHTVSHAILTSLAPDRRRAEVVESRREIEARLGRPCRLFAYPNGTEADFDASDRENLRAAGYACALTQLPGFNDHRTDLFALRRINIGQGHTGLLFVAYASGFVPWARRLIARLRAASRP